jgi:threonine synthase
MKAKILVPAYTPAAKTVQMRAYGAEIELVPGTRQDTSDEAVRQARDIFYASHNWQPFFLQGTKLLAYELWEDLGFRAPDHIVIPTGAGSNVLGCDIGFSELLARGEIARLPRLHAVQPANCAPFAQAIAEGLDTCPEISPLPTLAEGTAIARPVRPRQVLAAIHRSGGSSFGVSEAEIEAAARELALIGLYAEPTSAVAAAGLSQLMQSRAIGRHETAVVLLTGGGLKATQRWGEWVGASAS